VYPQKRIPNGGKPVTTEDVERARQQGATDKEIHDTVLIAAAFCMFNRHVDGLDTWQPHDVEVYREIGQRVVDHGDIAPGWQKPVSAAAK
jgi:hypothetical protein